MSEWTRREFVAGVTASMYAASSAAQEQSSDRLVLWYKKPAEKWTDALPIGNGRLGAMVRGGIQSELLQLNEDTLWSGSPRDWNNPDAKKHLPEVRRLVLEESDYVAADAVCKKMQGPYNESYLPMANLHIEADHVRRGAGLSPRVGSRYGALAHSLSHRRRRVHARSIRLSAGPGDRGASHHGRSGRYESRSLDGQSGALGIAGE